MADKLTNQKIDEFCLLVGLERPVPADLSRMVADFLQAIVAGRIRGGRAPKGIISKLNGMKGGRPRGKAKPKAPARVRLVQPAEPEEVPWWPSPRS